MAEKIKKSFFKVLPLSVVIFLVLGLAVAFTMPTPQSPGVLPVLAAGDNAVADITLLDTDLDGEINKVKVTVSNVGLATAVVYDLTGWTATDNAGVDPVTITAVAFDTNADNVGDAATATTSPLIIIVDLNEANVTPNDTLNADLEIIYTQQGINAGTEYNDATNTQLVAILTGDTNVTDTENDGAAPIIKTITYLDGDADGKIDRIKLDYSETVTAGSVLAANDLLFGNVGSFTDAAFGTDNTDLIGGADTSTTIVLGTESSTVATYDSTTFLAVSAQNAFSLRDSTNINSTLGSQTQATYVDGAAPILGGIGGAPSYQDNNSDGMVETLYTWWSENVIMTGSTAVDWTITGGSLNIVFSSAADDAGGNQVIYVTVTADANETGSGVAPTVSYDNDDSNNSITDVALNAAGTTGPQTLSDYSPTLPVSAVYKDTNGNGTIDRIDITMTAEFTISCNFQLADWSIPVPGSITINTPSACSVSGNDIRLTVAADAGETSSAVSPTILYSNVAPKGSISDSNFNQTPTFAGAVTATDGAAPVIMTTSPASGASEVAAAANVVITFSEPMTTGSVTYSLLPNPGGLAVGWTDGDTVATYTHTAFDTSTLFTYTATAGASAAAGDGSLAAGPVSNPFSFTTVVVGGGGGVSTTPDSLTVTAPNGGESWAGNSSHNITWSGTGANISKVKLLYSLDSGINFPYTIATNENNDGSYAWTVPNVATGTAKVKIEGYDSSSLLVTSDISDANFTITYVTPAPGTPETPGTPATPPVPETPLNELQAGDLFKSPLSTTVYYYGSDSKRHIFPNEKTYKSWYADFANIKSVSATTLQSVTLGKNVTARPGTVLVKIDTNPKVYAVEPGGLLRWVPTEARAITLYGSAWATKVIDVPVVFWVDYDFGTDITTDSHPTGALVKYASSADVFYIQNAEKRKVTSAGFTANNFQNGYILTIPTTVSYVAGTDLTVAENTIKRIY